MINSAPGHHYVIYLSLLCGYLLSLLPMPEWAQIYRPQWLALILIYWCMAVPERVGVGFGFVT